jgi:hypothetical protein
MISPRTPPTGAPTPFRCARCLEPLFERPENGMLGCKRCANDYFAPLESSDGPGRKLALLTVCCRKPITDFSQVSYSCPEHAFRHILPLNRIDPRARAMAESTRVRRELADQGRRFTRGVLFFVVGFFVLAATIALSRR